MAPSVSSARSQRAGDQSVEQRRDPRRDVELAYIRAAQAERDLARAVALARYAGLSWREIGEATGVSMQSAHQKWTARGVENLRANVGIMKTAKNSTENEGVRNVR